MCPNAWAYYMLVKEHGASPFIQVLKQQLCTVMLLLKHAEIFRPQLLQFIRWREWKNEKKGR